MSDDSELQHVPSTDIRLKGHLKARSSLARRGLEHAKRRSINKKNDELDAQVEAIYKLGLDYLMGGEVMQDYEKAMACFHKIFPLGHSGAAYELGNCYYLGLGGDVDKRWARILFTAAAEAGNAEAMYKVGLICEGIGEANFSLYGNPDYTQRGLRDAAGWYRKASSKGHLEAQRRLEELNEL